MQPSKQTENEEISTEEPAEEEANPHTDTRRRWGEEPLIEQPEHGRNETDGSRNPDIGPVTRHRFPLRQKQKTTSQILRREECHTCILNYFYLMCIELHSACMIQGV